MKNKSFLYLVIIFLVISCQKEEVDQAIIEEINNINEDENIVIEDSFYDQADIEKGYPLPDNVEMRKTKLFGSEVEIPYVNGNYIMGDMVLSPEDIKNTNVDTDAKGVGADVHSLNKRWRKKNGTGKFIVPYHIYSTQFTQAEKDNIRKAMDRIENYIGSITFRQTDFNEPYIFIQSLEGCWSRLGRVTNHGPQDLSLGRGCLSQATIIHELFHALGLYHEQSHPKRDDFVNLHLENLKNPRNSHNFRKAPKPRRVSDFNFKSFMMYGPGAFAKPGTYTMTKKDGSVWTRNTGLMPGTDKQVIIKLYPR
ncbi:M12 family metallopeptidase [uncultured Aquimarina sp.]|uniref:M12 family metallopeptidase n=1 Tax=uncultured Aquimarina sp. TaxID=575652 RepID=UPI00262A2676|nr:M12 family metallopeptidase [uncultured Aquimarina sp.]